eukprot:COSAG01_NODE_227_length_21107_cov_85.615099_5_plen_235_part_00
MASPTLLTHIGNISSLSNLADLGLEWTYINNYGRIRRSYSALRMPDGVYGPMCRHPSTRLQCGGFSAGGRFNRCDLLDGRKTVSTGDIYPTGELASQYGWYRKTSCEDRGLARVPYARWMAGHDETVCCIGGATVSNAPWNTTGQTFGDPSRDTWTSTLSGTCAMTPYCKTCNRSGCGACVACASCAQCRRLATTGSDTTNSLVPTKSSKSYGINGFASFAALVLVMALWTFGP